MYLERWAIDELTELSVTLLRSAHRGQVEAAEAALLAPVALQMESDVTSESWSEEVDHVLTRADLNVFLREAVGAVLRVDATTGSVAAEPQEPRDLREGDVYWLLAAEPVPQPARGAGAEQLLATCRRLGAAVVDVTPVARHAARVAYTQALLRTQGRS